MINRIEHKFIDKLDGIDSYDIQDLFSCSSSEVGEILENYFNNRNVLNGNVYLSRLTNLKTLGSVNKIKGSFSAMHTSLEDFGSLKEVHGNIHVVDSPITSTNKLRYCEGLIIESKTFLEFNKLTEVNGFVNLIETGVKNLGSLNEISGDLVMVSNEYLNSTYRLRRVIGSVVINDCPNLDTLDKLGMIGGSLNIIGASLTSFGDLTSLGGFVITKKSALKNFDTNAPNLFDLSPLNNFFGIPKSYLVKIPVMNNLEDFTLVVVDDDDDVDNGKSY